MLRIGVKNLKILGILPILVCCVLLILQRSAFAAQSVQAMRSVEVLSIDESGSPLRFPSGISYDREGDEIYVTSPQKNKLVVLTSDYFPYLSIGSGRGLNSISKSFIKNEQLYVCLGSSAEETRPHIAVFDMAFMPVKNIYFDDYDFFSPLDLVVADDGTMYVIGMNGTGVMVLDADGRFLHWIEPQDEVLGVAEKAPILAVDIGLDGRIYLLSEAMGRVYVYDRNEVFLYKFGEKGGEPGKLSRPRGIAVDDLRKQVYLVDYQRHTMSVYAQGGEYLFEVGGLGSGRGWFYYPSDVIVDGRGRVIVADTFNHRLQVFEFISNKGFGANERSQRQADMSVEPFVEETVVEAVPPKTLVHVRPLKDPLMLEESGDFLVMTAMTKQQRDAESLALKLTRKGYPVKVRDIMRGKSGRWFQVLVGLYDDPLEAYRVAEKLRAEEQLPAMLKTRGKAQDLEIPADNPAEPIENPDSELPGLTEKSAPLPEKQTVIETPLIEETALPEDPVATEPASELVDELSAEPVAR